MPDFSPSNLNKTWKEIYRSKPAKKRKYSQGIDGVSLEDFKENIDDLALKDNYLQELHRQLQGDFFVFSGLKKYFIKKKGKKKLRPIQAPIIKDRIVQSIINKYLMDNIFYKEFSQIGVVGSIKDISVKKIVSGLKKYYDEGYIYILKTDIQDYFPSINKKRLSRIFYHFVKDKKIRNFYNSYLGQTSETGIPQGCPLSPTMANLYLTSLDKKILKMKTIRHVRYIDDVIVLAKTKKRAEKSYKFIKKYLTNLGLSVHPLPTKGKTEIDLFDSGNIDILGVFYKSGKFYIKKKKLIEFLDEVVKPISKVSYIKSFKGNNFKEKISDFIDNLNNVIIGWGGAYKFCDVSELYKEIDKKIENNLVILLDKLKLIPNSEKIKIMAKVKKLAKLLK